MEPGLDRSAVWKINPDQFHRDLRHDRCTDLVTELLGPKACGILKALISLAAPSEKTKNEGKTEPILLARIASAAGASQTEVSSYLDVMAGATYYKIVEKVINGAQRSYKINYAKMMQIRKQKQLEGIVQEKFGVNGVRIFRLLHEKKRLEEKPVAELSMLEVKQARVLLFKMFKAGYIQLQEIPKSQDKMAAQGVFLWSNDNEGAFRQVISEMYKAMMNLSMRLKQELRAIEEQGQTNIDNMTEEAQRKLDVQSGKIERLEHSILYLDENLMLFVDH